MTVDGYDEDNPFKQIHDLFDEKGNVKLPNQFRLRKLSDIPMEPILWAWERRIPLRATTLVPGREGLGKTTMTYDIGARLTRGQLGGDLKDQPADVVVIGCEDTIASVAKPRLQTAGADLERIWYLETINAELGMAFSVPRDVPALRALLGEVPNPKLIIVDPLDAHLGVDTHRKSETQRAIGTLTTIAQDHDLAVLGIAHHSKAPNTDPLDRVNGSKAFTTSVRSVLTIAPHPHEESERVLACSKANLTKRETIPVLKFRIEERTAQEGSLEVATSGVVWLGETDIDPDSVLQGQVEEDQEAVDAESVLTAILQHGPMPVSVVLSEMAQAGFSKDQTKKAKVKIKAKSQRVGGVGADGLWQWMLP